MILGVIAFIIVLLFYSYVGVLYIDKKIQNKKIQKNYTVYFYIIYYILFFILCNIIVITVCNTRILNFTGPTGSIGFRGQRGERGLNGECKSECKIQEIKKTLINAIQKKYNTLTRKDKFQSTNIKLNIKDEHGNIIDYKLRNLLLNEIVENISYSREYKDSVEFKEDSNQVNNYIINMCDKWIDLIYTALPKSSKTGETNENFFYSKYAGSNANDNNEIKWINNKNPFDTIEKYDIYQWGKTRVIKPLTVKINNDPDTVNYLPIDHKPGIKIIHSNHMDIEYENVMNNANTNSAKKEKGKYPRNNNKVGVFWKNHNPLTYKKEIYYPMGDLATATQGNKTLDSLITTTAYIKDENETHTFSTKQKPDTSSKIEFKRNKVWDWYPTKLSKKYPGKDKVIYPPRNKQLQFNTPKKGNIMITGDVINPLDYQKMWDNKDSYEEMNVSIWRPKCLNGYESLGDISSHGYDKPELDRTKCIPKRALIENKASIKTLFETYDKKKIVGYATSDNNNEATAENSYNFFRFEDDKDKTTKKPLYKINEDYTTVSNTVKPVDEKYKRLGLGWNGMPLRDPKYSIYSYIVQMPEAIISNKATNFKYYIVHTDMYNNNIEKSVEVNTSAKNLYYILTLNINNNKYDRCLSVDGETNIIRNEIRNEEEAYWIIEPILNADETPNYDEIRLKSKKTGNYFKHVRKQNLRREIGMNNVFEKQQQTKQTPNSDDDNSLIFVNIKSAYGTNVETAIENSPARTQTKYYLNNEKNVNNKSKSYNYENRGIKD